MVEKQKRDPGRVVRLCAGCSTDHARREWRWAFGQWWCHRCPPVRVAARGPSERQEPPIGTDVAKPIGGQPSSPFDWEARKGAVALRRLGGQPKRAR
jgi:hypothetical protein